MSRHKNMGRKNTIKEAIENRGNAFSKFKNENKFSISEIAAYFRGKRSSVMGIPSYEYRHMSASARIIYGRQMNEAGSAQLAVKIAEKAEKMGVKAEDMGKDFEEACSNVETAAQKLLYKNIGYEKTENAIVSLVLSKNNMDRTIEVLDNMGSDAEIVVNVSKMLKAAKSFGLKMNDLGRHRTEAVDSLIRNSTSHTSFNPMTAIAKTVIEQNTNDAVELVVNKVIPQSSGGQVYDLACHIKGRKVNRRMDDAHYDKLMSAVSERFEQLNKAAVA